MPKRNTYKPYSLSSSAAQKKVLSIKQFLGVDYNPAQIAVSNDRATDIKNVVFKDKINRKRNGFEQLASVEPVSYWVLGDNGFYVEKQNTTNINGVWSFVGSDNVRHVVAHIGRLLFEIKNIGSNKTFFDFKIEPILKKVTSGNVELDTVDYELNDIKSSAFVGNKRLYILDGKKYSVLKIVNGAFVLKNVDSDSEQTSETPKLYVKTTLKVYATLCFHTPLFKGFSFRCTVLHTFFVVTY